MSFARQSIDLDVKNSYLNLDAAQKQVATYDEGIMKYSETLLEQVRQAYVLGAKTILDVMNAELTYRAVLSAYYNAVGTYTVATYTLQHSIGDLPDPPLTITVVSTGNCHACIRRIRTPPDRERVQVEMDKRSDKRSADQARSRARIKCAVSGRNRCLCRAGQGEPAIESSDDELSARAPAMACKLWLSG